MATLPVPPETGAVGAHGNNATCAAQAFFKQWGESTPLYFASLSIYFLLRVRYNVSDDDVAKKYEIYLHGVPILFIVVTCIAGLSMEVFNAIGLPEYGCWLGAYPINCGVTPESAPCERGALFPMYKDAIVWSFSHGPLWTSLFVVIVANFMINKTIRDQDRRNARYVYRSSGSERTSKPTEGQETGGANTNLEKSKIEEASALDRSSREGQEAINTALEEKESPTKELEGATAASRSFEKSSSWRKGLSTVASLSNSLSTSLSTSSRSEASSSAKSAALQSLLYVSTSFSTTIWSFLAWLGYKVQAEPVVRFYFAVTASIMIPLQGVFTLLIYIRPRYLRHRREQPEVSRLRAMIRSLCEAP